MKVNIGQHSNAGIKKQNEDSCGAKFPEEPLLGFKGISLVIADGVGSAEASKEASEQCVLGFLSDYYSTPESWSTRNSGEKVIQALNSWAYSQANKFQSETAFLTTLSALILKSNQGYIFHVGDSRIYHLRDWKLKQLTKDHAFMVDAKKSYLARAMGADVSVTVDFTQLEIKKGDVFILTTDGVHEFISDKNLVNLATCSPDLEANAKKIVNMALEGGSNDNLTCQIVKVEDLGVKSEFEILGQLSKLPFPPPLSIGDKLDHFHILKEIHASTTIQVYLAKDQITEETVVIKTPSINFEDDPVYIERFVHEEWVGRRIKNKHVLSVKNQDSTRTSLYYVTEFISGQSLEQWILDHPMPDLNKVRDIAKQVVDGLRGFHRKDMVHQDIKPENIMIDEHGRIKLIDFGCVQVAGLTEIYSPLTQDDVQGTANYIAPELFEGYQACEKTDMYSFGVTLYQMLTDHFPYGEVESAKPHKYYQYSSARKHNSALPIWVDECLKKAVQPLPENRYESFSELLFDLSNPNPIFIRKKVPLIVREPVQFWKWTSFLLFTLNVIFLYQLLKIG
ncbi:MAG: bifunctional protein-serine/threonine kinase/phosphatase [SAR324 cluster bacterium]|nr:bifunctional protein-serine/threonine kinase/phosphatase [SAR324 cluster bacterium]